MPQNKYFININLIKEEIKRNTENKINKITDQNLTYLEKKFIILKGEKTSTNYIINNDIKNDYKKEDNNNTNIFISNESNTYNNNDNISYSFSHENDSTFDKSNSYTNEQFESLYDLPINSNKKNNIDNSGQKFNTVRANFYLKYNLYDEILNDYLYYPPKYIINAKYIGLLYPNDLISYGFIQSGFLTKAKNKTDSDDIDYKNSKYNNILGLYFCGKNIEINIAKETHIKICAPNEFICKECMEINKKKYNLKQKYLININGRVAKINNGKYHCFGHFLFGYKENQIKDCINKFSCQACILLDEYTNYYQ